MTIDLGRILESMMRGTHLAISVLENRSTPTHKRPHGKVIHDINMDKHYQKKAEQRRLKAVAAQAGTAFVYAYRLTDSPRPEYGGAVPAHSLKDVRDRLAQQGLRRVSVKLIYPKN